MELIETLMVAMMAGMTKSLVDLLWVILQSIIYLFVNVSVIDEYAQIKLLDAYLAVNGICLTRNFDHTRSPMDGYHFAISWKWIIPTGFLVIHKTPESRWDSHLIIYWAGPGMHKLRNEIIGDPNQVYERHLTMLTPDKPSTRSRWIKPPDVANIWQSKLINEIVSGYVKNTRGSWVICGPPGCGKSTIGIFIAKKLAGLGVRPMLATGTDFTTPGLSINDAYHTPSAARPVILVLNEFDCAIRHAERDTSKDSTGARASTCIANTPTVLLNTLDYIASTPYLIIIATTNMKQSELTTGIYQRYTRPGRFDNYYQVRDNDIGSATRPKRGRAKKMRAA